MNTGGILSQQSCDGVGKRGARSGMCKRLRKTLWPLPLTRDYCTFLTRLR